MFDENRDSSVTVPKYLRDGIKYGTDRNSGTRCNWTVNKYRTVTDHKLYKSVTSHCCILQQSLKIRWDFSELHRITFFSDDNGNGAEMFGYLSSSLMVPKCTGSELSWGLVYFCTSVTLRRVRVRVKVRVS